jgi:hypothetical protein
MMKKIFALTIAVVLLFAPAVITRAQSGGPYTVTWSSTSSGGAYTLNAMLSSQGTSTSSGGGYTLGGVWAGAPEKTVQTRLPIVVQ